MKKLSFDYSNALGFMGEHEVEYLKNQVLLVEKTLEDKSGPGNDFLGWLDLPEAYDKAEFERIKKAAEKIKGDSEVLVVIGIGGSYLGAKSAIEFLSHTFYNNMPREKKKCSGSIFCRNKYIRNIYEASY